MGADVNYSGPTGISPIMWAAKRGHIELILLLIEKGANIKARSIDGNKFKIIYIKTGFNCLDWAIIHGQYAVS